MEFGCNGLLPLCKIQHLTKQLRTGDTLHDPRMIDVLDHHGEGFDGGLLDVDDILRSSKRTKELSPEDWTHCSQQEAMSRDLQSNNGMA